jgi:hypothetical protein
MCQDLAYQKKGNRKSPTRAPAPRPSLLNPGHRRRILSVLRTAAVILVLRIVRPFLLRSATCDILYVVAVVLALLATAAGQSVRIDERASRVTLRGKTYDVFLAANSTENRKSAVVKLEVVASTGTQVAYTIEISAEMETSAVPRPSRIITSIGTLHWLLRKQDR